MVASHWLPHEAGSERNVPTGRLEVCDDKTPTTMKTLFTSKTSNHAAETVDRKKSPFRSGSKSILHRYERRKIREQLRRLDWALAGVD
jgi:hypothetical protein